MLNKQMIHFGFAIILLLGIVTATESTFRIMLQDRVTRGNVLVRKWNALVESFHAEDKLLGELQESLRVHDPRQAIDVSRPALEQEIIAEHERRLVLLRSMQKLEGGN